MCMAHQNYQSTPVTDIGRINTDESMPQPNTIPTLRAVNRLVVTVLTLVESRLGDDFLRSTADATVAEYKRSITIFEACSLSSLADLGDAFRAFHHA